VAWYVTHEDALVFLFQRGGEKGIDDFLFIFCAGLKNGCFPTLCFFPSGDIMKGLLVYVFCFVLFFCIDSLFCFFGCT